MHSVKELVVVFTRTVESWRFYNFDLPRFRKACAQLAEKEELMMRIGSVRCDFNVKWDAKVMQDNLPWTLRLSADVREYGKLSLDDYEQLWEGLSSQSTLVDNMEALKLRVTVL